MKPITLLLPEQKTVSIDELTQLLSDAGRATRPRPFAPELVKLAGAFSEKLLGDQAARDYPELQVLGYWLRPAALLEMQKELTGKPGLMTVPQGLVFHIPPGNVDTLFAYSLVMSLLCGNANIVRMPSETGKAAALLLNILKELIATASDGIKNQQLIISYDHDADITEAISQHVNLRVIWGGDTTVNAIRQIPLSPLASELVFPDRFSWSAIHTGSYAALKEDGRQKLAEQYFNDLFWFDQAGCASPRVIVWCGQSDAPLTEDFYTRVTKVAETKKWKLDLGGNAAKQTRNYAAMADQPITHKRDFGSALTVFSFKNMGGLKALRANPCFGGTLFEIIVAQLPDIAPAVERRDQTLTCFGFEPTEVEQLALQLNGCGFDRIVPIGQALAFDTIWDGHNLLQSFTRLVKIQR